MTRVFIIFGILAYLLPALIVARAFYHNCKESTRRDARLKAKQFSNKVAAERAYDSYVAQDEAANFILSIFAFIGWPLVAVGQFINSSPRRERKRKAVLIEKQLEVANSMATWAEEVRKYPEDTISRETYNMLKKQFDDIEEQLKEFDE